MFSVFKLSCWSHSSSPSSPTVSSTENLFKAIFTSAVQTTVELYTGGKGERALEKIWAIVLVHLRASPHIRRSHEKMSKGVNEVQLEPALAVNMFHDLGE
jgi:hypothetical protein